MLPKEPAAKASVTQAKKAAATPATDDTAATGAKTQKRKPRKLNKEPTPTLAPTQDIPKPTTTPSTAPAEVPSPSELEALKSRVRGLEAKVEELYKAGAIPDSRPARSPRRRGKGRKSSSAAQVPTLSTTQNNANTSRVQEVEDDEEEEEEADEELVRLEGELEVARQDLESFRPRNRRTMSTETEDVEEIPRSSNSGAGADRQVTLSGSYRIPIPANVSVEDVKTIKSGVSAAQNVARSFLEQRRAAAALRSSTTSSEPAPGQFSSKAGSKVPASKQPQPKPKRTVSNSMEVELANQTGENRGGRQSWGEWIGGYSMAITRAVGKIEHEAAVEAQRRGGGGNGGRGEGKAPGTKKAAGKRPPAKAQMSSEQVHGLMS
jgi:hypothetical protein